MVSQNVPQAYRRTVSYIDKSREYYAAHGYERPYEWASFADVPFRRWSDLGRPLSEATIGLVTTAFPIDAAKPKRVYAKPVTPVPEAMYTNDLSWDKDATHTDDVGSFLPLSALGAHRGSRIGGLGARFYGVPTEYSQRRTEADAEQILTWCREDGVDAALLVPL